MNGRKTVEAYKEEIINAIGKIESYTKGFDLDSFVSDAKTYDATMMELVLIGELASKIPETIRAQNANIPWGKIIALRNRISHDYFSLDEAVLWTTIKESLPVLREEIQKIHDV